MYQEKNVRNVVHSLELAETQMQKLGLWDVIFLKISSQPKPVLFIPKRLYFLSEHLKISDKNKWKLH